MGNFPKWHALKALTKKSKASASDRMVAMALILHTDSEGMCFPSLDLLADETGLSERTVRTCIAKLAKGIDGFAISLSRGWRKGKWHRHSRVYRIVLDGWVREEAERHCSSEEAFEYDQLVDFTKTQTEESAGCMSTQSVDDEESRDNPTESEDNSKTDNKRQNLPVVDPNTLKRNGNHCRQQTATIAVPQTATIAGEDYKEDYTEVPDPDHLSVMALRSITSPEKPQTASRGAGGAERDESGTNQDETGRLTNDDLDDWDETTEYAGPRQLRLDGSVEPTCKQVRAALCDRVWSRYMEHWHKHVGRGQVPKRTKDRRQKIVRRIHEFGIDKVLLAIDTLFNPDSFWGANGHHGIQYVIRSADQCEKVLTRAAELADPSLAPKRRSVAPMASTNGTVRSMSGDNAPIQLPPEGHKGYRARINFTPDGAFDQEGNRVEVPHTEASREYLELARRRQAERRAKGATNEDDGLRAVAEA